jgi:hypothetical protein
MYKLQDRQGELRIQLMYTHRAPLSASGERTASSDRIATTSQPTPGDDDEVYTRANECLDPYETLAP